MRNPPSELHVEGRSIRVSNLDKVLYPKAGFTKADVIRYYIETAPALLPHLQGRPLTLKRYPNGVEEAFFYEKKCPSHRPDWVKTASVWSERKQSSINYCLANDLPTLVWAANLADLELHTSLARANHIETPTMMVFDLDPGAPAGIIECCELALHLRKHLKSSGLECFPKTSGSKGLQIYVPLNTPVTYATTKNFAKALAQQLEHDHPRGATSRMAKNLRGGKVFIDWSQNDQHKTTVCVYSLRAREQPAVSTPLKWAEVQRACKSQNPERLSFVCADVLKRVKKEGDLFAPVLSLKQPLEAFPESSPRKAASTKTAAPKRRA